LPGDRRKKYEQLITAIVHERDVTRTLIKDGTVSATAFEWLYHMRVSERAATIQAGERERELYELACECVRMRE
jgi:hypothetical protein